MISVGIRGCRRRIRWLKVVINIRAWSRSRRNWTRSWKRGYCISVVDVVGVDSGARWGWAACGHYWQSLRTIWEQRRLRLVRGCHNGLNALSALRKSTVNIPRRITWERELRSLTMGKRKKSSRKPAPSRQKVPLGIWLHLICWCGLIASLIDTAFTCLFCHHDKSVTVRLDRKEGVAHLVCRVCDQRYQSKVNRKWPRVFSLSDQHPEMGARPHRSHRHLFRMDRRSWCCSKRGSSTSSPSRLH